MAELLDSLYIRLLAVLTTVSSRVVAHHTFVLTSSPASIVQLSGLALHMHLQVEHVERAIAYM